MLESGLFFLFIIYVCMFRWTLASKHIPFAERANLSTLRLFATNGGLMQIQNSAHLNCCCVHGIHSLIAIPLARHKDCLSASVSTKKLWQRTRGAVQFAFEYAARGRTIIQSAHRRRRRCLSRSHTAHSKSLPLWPRYLVSSGANALAAEHYAFAENRRRITHLCTMYVPFQVESK